MAIEGDWGNSEDILMELVALNSSTGLEEVKIPIKMPSDEEAPVQDVPEESVDLLANAPEPDHESNQLPSRNIRRMNQRRDGDMILILPTDKIFYKMVLVSAFALSIQFIAFLIFFLK